METTSGTPAETTRGTGTSPTAGPTGTGPAPRLAGARRRPAARAGATPWLIAAAVAAVVVIGGYVAFWSARDEQPLLINLTAPRDYSGWLVISWACAGGERLSDSLEAGNRYSLTYADDGSLCIADPFPEQGYRVLTYRHDGLSEGQVASPFLRAGPSTVEVGSGADTVLDPAIGAGSEHHYDVTWVELRRLREGQDRDDVFPAERLQLGDQCSLVTQLQTRFGEPAITVPCGPLPTRITAGLDGSQSAT